MAVLKSKINIQTAYPYDCGEYLTSAKLLTKLIYNTKLNNANMYNRIDLLFLC